MAQFTELQVHTALLVGPQVAADGAVVRARGDKQGAGVITQLHGKYFEAAYRRKLFYSHAAAVAMGIPHTTALGNIVWNPPDSGTLLALAKWSITYQVTDADCLAADLCYSAQAVLPTVATAISAAGCNYLAAVGAGGGVAKCFAAAAITTAGTPIYRLAVFAAAVEDKGMDQCEGDFDGGIIVPPGYLVTVHTLVAAAAAGVTSTLWWEEVAI